MHKNTLWPRHKSTCHKCLMITDDNKHNLHTVYINKIFTCSITHLHVITRVPIDPN